MATLTQDNIKKGVINGTNQKDVIAIDGNNVSSKKLTIKAGNGDDEINAKNFDGTLYVYAGMGSDIIYASQGNNYLYGESGTNKFVINPDSKNTVISAGKGAAIIDFTNVEFVTEKFFSGKFVDDNFVRVKNDLVVNLDSDSTVTIKDFYKQRGEFLFAYKSEGERLLFDARRLELVTDLEGTKTKNYTGGRLNEDISGNELNNTLKGGDGNDNIWGGDGNDKLYGDNGSDILIGNDGNDTLYAGEGAEKYLSGGEGDDIIYGSNTGVDTIDGGTGNNKLYGGKGVNYYVYSGGNDTIYLVKDSETILCLDGYIIEEKAKNGNDLKLFLSDEWGEGGSILLKDYFKIKGIGETISIYSGTPDDEESFKPYEFSNNEIFDDNIREFQIEGKGTIKGTEFNDYIEGSEKADKIYAVGGEDKIIGSAGNDTIYAGESYSTAFFSKNHGNDKLYGDFYNLVFDTLYDHKQLKFKKVGDDLVINHTERDSVTLVGYFAGKSYAELVTVGMKITQERDLSELLEEYQNTLTYKKGDGNVKFYSMPNSINTVNFDNYTEEDILNVKVAKSGNNLVFSGIGAKNDKITVVDYFKDGIDVNIQLDGIDIEPLNAIMEDFVGTIDTNKYNGTIFNQVLTGTNGNDIIKTKDGHDIVNGSNGNDTVYAGSGNDIINYEGYNGDLKLYGESGNDTITSGDGNDNIWGGDGNDTIMAGIGNDIIYGGNGDDIIMAGVGSDFVDGGAGNDQIYGGDGDSTLKGGKGNDLIYGGGGVNTIYGGAGDDSIYVVKDSLHTSNNLVHGDAGNDNIEVEEGVGNIIYGDAGDDCITVYLKSSENKIYGGSGNDSIYINSNDNEIYAGAGNDYLEIKAIDNIVDAGAGNDTIKVLKDFKEIQGGSGNDTIIINGGSGEIKDSAGNDTYVINKIEEDAIIIIDDLKGNDTIQLGFGRQNAHFLFDVNLNSKGKIVNSKDIDLYILVGGEEQGIVINDYFGSGCVERIEMADGYYITKDQMNNVMQEVVAWLSSNGCSSMTEGFESENSAELIAIYQAINWQQ